MTMHTVYAIKSNNTGHVYVGRSMEIDKRLKRHLYELANDRHHNVTLQATYNREGKDSLTFREVASFSTLSEAVELEESLIDFLVLNGKAFNIGLASVGGDNLTNHPDREYIVERLSAATVLRLGSMSALAKREMYSRPGESNPMFGRTHTDAAKAKISAAHLGNNYCKGKVLSEAHCKAISESAKLRVGGLNSFFGKTHSAATKEKIAATQRGRLNTVQAKEVSIDGIVYRSLTQAASSLGVHITTLSYRVKSPNPRFNSYFYTDSITKCLTTIESGEIQ
jgi:group I intron endonuclease